MTEQIAPVLQNPFIGPRPFGPGHTLYGREREIRDLRDLLIAERIVLLHSPSGAGKTSLIQAGLAPVLEREEFQVLPIIRVGTLLDGGGGNRYLQSAMAALEEAFAEEDRQDGATLAGLHFGSYLDRRFPATNDVGSVVLIFDQFEEILSIDPVDRAGKETFFAEVGQALRNRQRWALFAVREEYVARLEFFQRTIPTRFSNTFQLRLLSPVAAVQAIARPSGGSFTPNLVSALVDNLRCIVEEDANGIQRSVVGDVVEPVQLQVVCRDLWQRHQPTPDRPLDAEAVTQFDSIDQALRNYYATQVMKTCTEIGITPRTLRDWFDQALIQHGIRAQVRHGPAREDGGYHDQVLAPLVDMHIVRTETRRGATWYELAHDRLIEPILADNKDWRIENLSPLQRQAALWHEQGRSSGLLLDDAVLVQIEKWADEHRDTLEAHERDFLVACQERQVSIERNRRKNRRIRLLAVVAVVVSVLAIIATIFAVDRTRRAVEAQQRARTAEAISAENAQTAERERQNAELNAEKALEAQAKAEYEAAIARARQLAAQSSSELANHDYELALLLAIEAGRATAEYGLDAEEAFNAIRNVIARPARSYRVFYDEWDFVTDVAWSPDESKILIASGDGAVHIWDTSGRSQDILLKGHTQSVEQGIWSRDGSRVLTRSEDGTARIWDATTGIELVTLEGHSGRILQATWNSNESMVITSGVDGTARIWGAETGSELQTFVHQRIGSQSDWIDQVILSGDETKLLTVGSTVTIWDIESTTILTSLQDYRANNLRATWSQDISKILTASTDHTARVWDATTGEETVRLGGHEKGVYQATWSADESKILTASADQTARIWDAETGQELAKLEGHEDSVLQAIWSADESKILTASADQTARIWDAETGQELAKLEGHEDSVTQAAWSADKSKILTASDDHTMRIWDAESGAELARFVGHEGRIYQATWSHDESMILSRDHGSARLWYVEPGEELVSFEGHEARVRQAIWSQDETKLLTASDDNTARIWIAETGTELVRFADHGDSVLSATWNQDESRVLTTGSIVTLWDAATGARLITLEGGEDWPKNVLWSPNGTRILAIVNHGVLRVWNAETGEALDSPEDDEHYVFRAEWNQNGSKILTSSNDNTARIWDAETSRELLALVGHENAVLNASWSQDGSSVLTVSSDHTARVWSTETGAELTRLQGHDATVRRATWSRDESKILTLSDDQTVRIWSAETGENLATLGPHAGDVSEAIWSKDESRVLTISDGKILRIWDVETQNEVVLLEPHDGPVYQAAWNQDESRVLAVCGSYNACIWDAESGRRLVTLRGHEDLQSQSTLSHLSAAFWSQDGSKILTISDERTVRIWYANMTDLIASACRQLPRNFTWTEWQRYMGTDYVPTCSEAPIPPEVIEAIHARAVETASSGQFITAIMMIEHLNGWLHESGQYSSFGVEPNVYLEVTTDAPALLRDIPVTGTLDSPFCDPWKLEIDTGSRITITLSATDNRLDPYLTLYGPDFELLAENDDVGTDGSRDAALFAVPLSEPGIYWVVAGRCCPGNDLGSVGDYSLEVIVRPDE